jgi:hypothetical protein
MEDTGRPDVSAVDCDRKKAEGKSADESKQEDDKSKSDKEKEEESETKAAGGSSGDGKRKYPPYRPLPIGALYKAFHVGTMNVFGQEPTQVGRFDSVKELLDMAHSRKGLPGGSNTIFATVRKVGKIDPKSLHGGLKGLPDELTIIVHEE